MLAGNPQSNGMATILVLEDNAFNLSVFETVLQRAGYTVLGARTGAQARQVAATHRGAIDLLIADVVLEDGRGPDVARQLRDARPNLRCLLISGYTDDELRYRGLLPPAAERDRRTEFLQKPFRPDALLATVASMLAPER